MKKSNALFLSRKELETFESLYQGLKDFPGWRMQNIFNQQTREHYAVYNQCSRELAKSANRKNTLFNVANHEAGHAVVMAAIHSRINKVAVENQYGEFGGYVRHEGFKELSDCEPLENAPMPKKAEIISDMLTYASGFAAEHLYARHSHAYHEKLISYCQCRFLDEHDSAKPLNHWNYFMSWCKRIISRNQALFYVVVEDLLNNKVMTEQIKNKLHNEVRKEPLELFFN